MAVAHNLGFPRIGLRREMKKAVEAYWRGELSQEALLSCGQKIQQAHWQLQKNAGLDLIPVGDFSWYDHVLDTSLLFGIIPQRFLTQRKKVDIDTYFCMARGQAPNGNEAVACEMTKWFDTNYHYLVPEFSLQNEYKLHAEFYLEQIKRALKQGYSVKPVLLGPLSLVYLGKVKDNAVNKFDAVNQLIPLYNDLLQQVAQLGVEWVQIDEPILALDLAKDWHSAFQTAYANLATKGLKILLGTYFDSLGDNQSLACGLPIHGLHIDICRAPQQLAAVHEALAVNKVLSVGVVDGRNIWRSDLEAIIATLKPIAQQRKNQLWVGPSCSLLHSPIDLDVEEQLNPEIKSWLAFAKQKVREIALICCALNGEEGAIESELRANKNAVACRKVSSLIHNQAVKSRVAEINDKMTERLQAYKERAKIQKEELKLPLYPTTTIGSFPQTNQIRRARRDYKSQRIDGEVYRSIMQQEIAQVIHEQEKLGLDVLVHGEPERNDMVEYFGEQLQGVAFTQNGWVQSYGSRCVKPPIIFGDISRPHPMTVAWSQYAQSLTPKLVKGMLTGPVTILAWSFVRDDQPKSQTALQLALVLRDEVCDLEAAGIKIIQIDEPAFRETLPLKKCDWQAYLEWAVRCFRISASGVKDATQIHTHMCYSEFNDVIESIAALDADVITLESSRSDMELLKAFEDFAYPNEIGPGVYDIHSPRVPTTDEIYTLIAKALRYIPRERLWINPDCGLKTRQWTEVRKALVNMVAVAHRARKQAQNGQVTEVRREALIN